ncbi:hypothetical protein GCM10010193_37330 [Kitasatospora atroaurantiaca]
MAGEGVLSLRQSPPRVLRSRGTLPVLTVEVSGVADTGCAGRLEPWMGPLDPIALTHPSSGLRSGALQLGELAFGAVELRDQVGETGVDAGPVVCEIPWVPVSR